MKVIALTAAQETQLAALRAAAVTATRASGEANKAYQDAIKAIAGPGMNPVQRAQITDDGKSLVIG